MASIGSPSSSSYSLLWLWSRGDCVRASDCIWIYDMTMVVVIRGGGGGGGGGAGAGAGAGADGGGGVVVVVVAVDDIIVVMVVMTGFLKLPYANMSLGTRRNSKMIIQSFTRSTTTATPTLQTF